MALTRLEYKKTWTSSGDFPTYEDSEQQVRADLQYHPDAIRNYLNGTVAPAVEGLEEAQTQMGEKLDEHGQAIVDLAAGNPPEAVKAARVEFGAEDWAALLDGDGVRLIIPQSAHRRKNGDFGYTLWDGDQTGTWNTLGTDVRWDGETGDVSLLAEEAFAGAIVFFGV